MLAHSFQHTFFILFRYFSVKLEDICVYERAPASRKLVGVSFKVSTKFFSSIFFIIVIIIKLQWECMNVCITKSRNKKSLNIHKNSHRECRRRETHIHTNIYT